MHALVKMQDQGMSMRHQLRATSAELNAAAENVRATESELRYAIEYREVSFIGLFSCMWKHIYIKRARYGGRVQVRDSV